MHIQKNRIEKMTHSEVMGIVESCWERLDNLSRRNVIDGVNDKIKHYVDLNAWNERTWKIKGKYNAQISQWWSVLDKINAL
jgi:hypothetical protein